jgi:two-component system CheB/CheR fusion protein
VVHELRTHQVELELQNRELRESQQVLEAARSRYAEFYDQAPVGYLTLDRRGVIRHLNLTAAALLGRERPSLLDRPLGPLLAEGFTPILLGHLREAFASGARTVGRLRLRPDAQGRVVELRADSRRFSDGDGEPWCLTTLVDVSEQVRAEQALRDSERRFRALTEKASEFVHVLDVQGKVLMRLGMADNPLGYGREELIGRNAFDLVHPDDLPGIRAQFERLLGEPGASERSEMRVRAKDGSWHWVLTIATNLLDEPAVAGVVLNSHDISERKQAEQLLRSRAQRKNEFLATLAHELRNPLAPIRSALDLLGQNPSLDPAAQSARAMMERQLASLVRLVDDLLDVSRITRGKVTLRKEIVTLTTIVDRAVEAAMPHIRDAGHDISIALPPEPIYLEADPDRLAQVFLNLLNNARKFTARGGHIRFTAERDGHDVVVTVADNGIGIDPQMLPQVFDIFTQAQPLSQQSDAGLGIGLALVHNLVELHGGRVQARSDGPGTGSVFSVRLPVAEAGDAGAPDVPGPSAAKPTSETPTPRRILLVDDNRDVADSLALLLELAGHEVRKAHDGRGALTLAADFVPDVIVLDIGLPDMDGRTLARELRKLAVTTNALLIAVTGYGDDRDRARSLAAGIEHHLVKPVSVADILALLDRPH